MDANQIKMHGLDLRKKMNKEEAVEKMSITLEKETENRSLDKEEVKEETKHIKINKENILNKAIYILIILGFELGFMIGSNIFAAVALLSINIFFLKMLDMKTHKILDKENRQALIMIVITIVASVLAVVYYFR